MRPANCGRCSSSPRPSPPRRSFSGGQGRMRSTFPESKTTLVQMRSQLRAGALLVVAAAGLCLARPACAEAEPPVVLGIATHEAAQHNTEFLKYSRMLPVYQQRGIAASLVEQDGLCHSGWSEEKLLQLLKGYHVVHLTTTEEGVQKITPPLAAQAKIAGAALARFVREGGGLFLQPRAVRYPGDDDERYWNLVLERFGCEILHEGNYDKTRTFDGQPLPGVIGKLQYWFTKAIKPHSATDGVRCLYLPLHDYGSWPGQPAMRYSADWEVIVAGEKEARSYKSGVPGDPNELDLAADGTYATAPPVVAVRQFGQGRILCFPLSPLHTGMNYGNPLWQHIVETRGDAKLGQPSDTLKLQLNACRWLAGPAQQAAGFGTVRPPPYKPVEFPKSAEWDSCRFEAIPAGETPAAPGVRGIFGAHTGLSDGKGTVADYAAAAKAARLSVVVFNEPLEKLTAEALNQLKADCAAASGADFYACPGIEFSDGLGNRWAFWGEKVVYPDTTFGDPYHRDKKFTLWDGQRIHHYGEYAILCSFPPSALLDYKQLRANGAHPENLWWFYHYFPLVYDHGKPVADNYGEFLFGLRDLRWSAVASFTRITEPNEVAAAAQTFFTGFRDVPSARAALNTRCAAYWAASTAQQYASQGPRILSWSAFNTQMEQNWRHTRGAQRVRLRFAVQSDAGIREVAVHDSDRGPIRRYLGQGAKVLVREFELVHDQQHYLTLEVTDGAGRRAFSHYLLVFCYKQGLFRCGDNLNILGATGMLWHPDRNEMFTMARQFHNGENFTLEGWDRGGALCPMPRAFYEDLVYIRGVGPYPHRETLGVVPGRQMDVAISSYNFQVATMHMRFLAQGYDTAERPTPALCTIPKDLGENEYFERTHTIYAPEDRRDMYIVWNHRRRREGEQRYQGGFIWHEGEIRFKKDLTLTGQVPISLVFLEIPTDLEKGWGHSVVTTDADGVTRVGMLSQAGKTVRAQGRLRPGGYAAQMPSIVGHIGFFAPPGSDFAYQYTLPGRLYIGLGRDGQDVKAGDRISYRFAICAFATEEAGNASLEHTLRALNLAGGKDGYPVQMKAGELADATFFFTARAADGAVAFALGSQKLTIDLPIRVQGVADNGCAAVYSSQRPWFRFVAVHDGTAYFQESIEAANDLWAGNVFLCDNPAVKLTLVVDGQADGKKPFLEAHNPTDAAITATLRSPAHAPLFGGIQERVTLPAGDSVLFEIDGRTLRPLQR